MRQAEATVYYLVSDVGEDVGTGLVREPMDDRGLERTTSICATADVAATISTRWLVGDPSRTLCACSQTVPVGAAITKHAKLNS